MGKWKRPGILIARVTSSNITVNKRRKLRFGYRAYLGRRDIAVLEEHQRRNPADAVFGRRGLILIDIELGDLQLAVVLLGHFVEDRRDHLAGPAPFRPV